MQLFPPEKGFLGLSKPEATSLKESRAVIIPFGLESSVSYGGGTRQGPQAIIKASHEVELFDEEFWREPFTDYGVATLKPFPIKKNLPDAMRQIEKTVDSVLAENKFPLILGGEHSLTVGAIRAVVKKIGAVSILHFDAHADLRDGYLGEQFSHASAIRRCLDDPAVSVVSVGIRNISAEEISFLGKNSKRIKIFWASSIVPSSMGVVGGSVRPWKTAEIVKALGDRPVYLSFDLDSFDASLMPATGTPEPGGLFWDETIAIIRAVAKKRKIIGADIVELAPIKNLHASNFIAAKLAYKILNYALEKKK